MREIAVGGMVLFLAFFVVMLIANVVREPKTYVSILIMFALLLGMAYLIGAIAMGLIY